MSNLTLIKPNVYKVQIDGKTYYLKYDLMSFAFIEEQLGSVKEAIELFNKKDLKTVAIIFQAGLLHEKVDASKLSEKTNFDELVQAMAEAIQGSISQDYNFSEEIDWPLLYYIIKPALNMSEVEFWSSTHKQMLGFLKTLEKQGKEVETRINQEQAIKEFKNW